MLKNVVEQPPGVGDDVVRIDRERGLVDPAGVSFKRRVEQPVLITEVVVYLALVRFCRGGDPVDARSGYPARRELGGRGGNQPALGCR